MKGRTAIKAADKDEAKSNKIRSSRGKRRRGRRSRSLSDSGSPARKRSKKKIADKKSKKNKGGSRSHRRRRRSLYPSRSPSSSPSSVSRSYSHRSCTTCHSSSSSASERSVSPPPRSHSRDIVKGKGRGRGRGREKDRKRRRTQRWRSCSSGTSSSGRSRSRSRIRSKSRKRRVAGTRDDASRDEIAQYHDNCRASWTEKNSIGDVGRDEEAVAVAKKGPDDIDGHEKNVGFEMMDSQPPKDANETEEILPAGSGGPEAEDLELILRQKALENFRKFKGATVMAGKTDNNGTGKEVLTDSSQSTVTKIAEARSAVTPFQRQGSSLGVSHSAGSPRLNDFGNGTGPLKPESSPGMSRGAGSPGILEAGDTSSPIEQQRSGLEATLSASQIRLQDGRNSGGVMQRLGSVPGSSASVKQRLRSSAGVSLVNGTPKVRSVVSIPTRGGVDGSTFITALTACENSSAPVESSSEVRHPPIETKKVEGTNGDDRKTSEASTPNGSILSAAEGNSQAGIEGKDGSQFEKKTFSRMHDGETVQVSYKVYIPKKGPALARRKLQR